MSPVGGRSHKEPHGGGDEPVRLNFVVMTRMSGHGAVAEDEDAPERVEIQT